MGLFKNKTKQMTSIEWLVKELKLEGYDYTIQRAKEMHRFEIEEAFKHGKLPPFLGQVQTAKEYYQETFGSKGSNVTSSQTTSEKWKEYQDWLNEHPEDKLVEITYTEEQLKLAYMQGYNRGVDGNPNQMESYIEQLKQL